MEINLPAAHLLENNPRITREKGSRAYPLGEPGRPGRQEKTIQEIFSILNWLDVEKSLRYQRKRHITYCNIYATDFAYLSGVYLPRVWWSEIARQKIYSGQDVPVQYGKTVYELSANALYRWLQDYSKYFGWLAVNDPHSLQLAVNQGRIGVIAAINKDPKRPGHISIALPETGDCHADRAEGRVHTPLQSQAGYYNYRVFTDAWWKSAEFLSVGFWIHD